MRNTKIIIDLSEKKMLSTALVHEAFQDFDKMLGIISSYKIINGRAVEFEEDTALTIIVEIFIVTTRQLHDTIVYLIGSLEGYAMYNFGDKCKPKISVEPIENNPNTGNKIKDTYFVNYQDNTTFLYNLTNGRWLLDVSALKNGKVRYPVFESITETKALNLIHNAAQGKHGLILKSK